MGAVKQINYGKGCDGCLCTLCSMSTQMLWPYPAFDSVCIQDGNFNWAKNGLHIVSPWTSGSVQTMTIKSKTNEYWMDDAYARINHFMAHIQFYLDSSSFLFTPVLVFERLFLLDPLFISRNMVFYSCSQFYIPSVFWCVPFYWIILRFCVCMRRFNSIIRSKESPTYFFSVVMIIVDCTLSLHFVFRVGNFLDSSSSQKLKLFFTLKSMPFNHYFETKLYFFKKCTFICCCLSLLYLSIKN